MVRVHEGPPERGRRALLPRSPPEKACVDAPLLKWSMVFAHPTPALPKTSPSIFQSMPPSVISIQAGPRWRRTSSEGYRCRSGRVAAWPRAPRNRTTPGRSVEDKSSVLTRSGSVIRSHMSRATVSATTMPRRSTARAGAWTVALRSAVSAGPLRARPESACMNRRGRAHMHERAPPGRAQPPPPGGCPSGASEMTRWTPRRPRRRGSGDSRQPKLLPFVPPRGRPGSHAAPCILTRAMRGPPRQLPRFPSLHGDVFVLPTIFGDRYGGHHASWRPDRGQRRLPRPGGPQTGTRRCPHKRKPWRKGATSHHSAAKPPEEPVAPVRGARYHKPGIGNLAALTAASPTRLWQGASPGRDPFPRSHNGKGGDSHVHVRQSL